MNARLRRSLTATLAASVLAAVGFAGTAQATTDANSSTVDIQMLAINDFHGNLEPPTGSSGRITTGFDATGKAITVDAGGAEYLATHLKQARVGHPNTMTVAAGDLIGASPLLSAAFHDEPTILSMNKLGLDVTAVGNHEFDEGKDELLRMAYGGCRTDDGCYDPNQPFTGAKFPYLAANVVRTDTGQPLLPPYWIKNFNGARIGFIGMTLKGTPDIVTAAGVQGLSFTDEVETANKYVPILKAEGVRAIVVLLHQGGDPASTVYNYDCNAGGPGSGIAGPIVDIAKRLDPQIDVVVTGHTHQSYVCNIPDPAGQPRLVTSASSFGRLYTDIELTYDKKSQDIVRAGVTATNMIVTRDVTKDAEQTALISQYKTLIAPIANKVVGYISADIRRTVSDRESPLGDLIGDAQLAATSAPANGGAVIAMTNPGGIRSDLTYAQSGAEGDGVVTYAEAFTVQPFNNYLVTMDLTGQQLLTVLQQQFSGTNAGAPKLLQVSSGLTYTVDSAQSGAAKVVANSIMVNGAPLDLAHTYRVTVNNFLAGGGDGFPALAGGTNQLNGVLDVDAFTAYMTATSSAAAPIAPPAANRITFIN
jgi:5'-nucleotidase